MSATHAAARPFGTAAALPRAFTILALLGLELFAFDYFYNVRAFAGADATPLWLGVNAIVKHGAFAAIYAMAAFAVLLWPERRAVLTAWTQGAEKHPWRLYAGASAVLAAALVCAEMVLQHATLGAAAWAVFGAWAVGAAIALALLLIAFAPAPFWRSLVRGRGGLIVASIGAGIAIAGAAYLSQRSWDLLADATLRLSFYILYAFEPSVWIDLPSQTMGLAGFNVWINSYCSGYEGVGLVLASLGLYIAAFRKKLRFPHVLALLPLAGLTVWVLNAVRIAALVAIGAYVSPDLAIDGFHSQAGWIAFLGVTTLFILIAHGSSYFRRQAPSRALDSAVVLALALLAPFAALMAGRMLVGVAGGGPWLQVGVMAAPLLALTLAWPRLRALFGPLSLEPIAVGVLVGALWIATQPHGNAAPLGAWLDGQDAGAAALWLALRCVGFALIVPLAEELAFRGYLHRALLRRRFDEAPPAAFGWLPFVAASLLFGAMHGRWLAGALAGAAFALTLYRSKSLTGPVAAHVAANAAIFVWAAAMQDWALL
jgi:exosortase E/protease (VPEID-CTERM system)